MIGLSAGAVRPAVAQRGNAWREVFQSSPADYDALTPDTERRIIEQMKVSQAFLEGMRPKPPVKGTVRFRFAVSVGGRRLRVRLSNEEGHTPLLVSAASIGVAAEGFAAMPGSVVRLTFRGMKSIMIPAGAPAISDPIALAVTPGAELVASIYVPDGLQLLPAGGGLMAVDAGDQTLRDGPIEGSQVPGRPFVTGVEVLTARPPQVIVTLGDSITDGNRLALGALRGWPEQLSRRLATRRGGPPYAVVNAGIAGNRILNSISGKAALARLDRDVLRVEGVSHVIVLEGTNDIGMSGKSLLGESPLVTLDELITSYGQIIARAHARRIKVILATITPFGGAITHFTPEKERLRQGVNTWIRSSRETDGVIDFDRNTRDPVQPSNMRSDFASPDRLHPSQAGYKAMGDAIDLALFR